MSDKDKKQDDTVEVEASQVHVTDGRQSSGLFGSLFGGLFDIFGDEDDEDFPVDVFERDFVEVDDVEIIDAPEVDEPPAKESESPFKKFRKKFRK